jgi:hypothetical protein
MQTSSNITSAIQPVYKYLNKKKLIQTNKVDISREIQELEEFLQIKGIELMLLTSIIHISIERNEEVRLTELADHYGLEYREFIPYLDYILHLCAIGLLEKEEGSIFKSLLNTEVRPSENLVKAIIMNDATLIRPKSLENIQIFFLEYNRIWNIRKKNNMDLESFNQQIEALVQNASHIAFIQFLNSLKLPLPELHVLLCLCHIKYKGTEQTNINEILNSIFGETEAYYKWTELFYNKTAQLFKKSLIETADIMFGIEFEVRLSKTIYEKLFKPSKTKKTQETFDLGIVLQPDKLNKADLCYSLEQGKKIALINQALDEEYYKKLRHNLVQNQLKPGLTILFHGPSGTGKTETVYQLAKTHKRDVLLVDASKIRSMWIGEAEKNIRNIFNEYRKFYKKARKKPILLFNEADGIFSSRTTVVTCVDAIENTMQNILLQELEDFEGILIATTNLIKNIDSAFERRFLFKIEFQNPKSDIRLKILKSKFPKLNTTWLNILAEKYTLSGGQIENLKRKLLIEQTVLEETELNFEKLDELFLQESGHSFSVSNSKVIGFKHSSSNN